MDPILIGVVVVGALLLLWLVALYNGLVQLRNHVKNAWSQIDVQLQRRHDLVPNLVETVKGYASHEKDTLDRVIRARSQAVAATDVTQKVQAETELSNALGRLMVVVEQYPDLKANQNFLGLQEELTSTENRIGFSRQHYNDSVMRYNTRIESFPSNLIASTFSFHQEPFFEVADVTARKVPEVKF